MTALERNAASVGLACYAPMLANVSYVNWKPDMIWFDNHRAFGTPNYYVQKLFMNHQGSRRLSVSAEGIGVVDSRAPEYRGKIRLKAMRRNPVLTRFPSAIWTRRKSLPSETF